MSTVYSQSFQELEPWIRTEVELQAVLGRGDRGAAVRRAQEWLTLSGHGVVIDGDFGPATERAVTAFQTRRGLVPSRKVDHETWAELTGPMTSVLRQRLDSSMPLGEATLVYARAHLQSAPREVGGANRGPWVRLYMRGHQGAEYAWCAGFVTFLMRQAADSMAAELPIAGSFSCDTLAAQAEEAGVLVVEADASPETVTPGSLFLVRRTAGDWTHTGLVVEADDDTFTTIEGNTNDAGDREGYEVCARTRSWTKKDFVLL